MSTCACCCHKKQHQYDEIDPLRQSIRRTRSQSLQGKMANAIELYPEVDVPETKPIQSIEEIKERLLSLAVDKVDEELIC